MLTVNRIVHPKSQLKKGRNNVKCIIHCTDSKEALSLLPLPRVWKKILEAKILKYVMIKEFWKLLNPWNLKRTSLTSNTIAGVEEYTHTVEL